MSDFPLSTGEAVQHVLEGRECEMDLGWRMCLVNNIPRITLNDINWAISKTQVHLRWRLVPALVKREEALKALDAGKTIQRKGHKYVGRRDPLVCKAVHPLMVVSDLVEDFLDDTACWEILP